MRHNVIRMLGLFFVLSLSLNIFAQEEETPAPSSSAVNNLYYVENRWGDEEEAHQGGLWVLGGRQGQPIVSLNIASSDDGLSFEGEMVYEGEGAIDIRGTLIHTNTYAVENHWSSDPAWYPGGVWVIGVREEQPIVAVNIELSDTGDLTGEVAYLGEGPISFTGTPIDGGVFATENNWSSDAEWHIGGVWVIGGRGDQAVASLNIASSDEGETFEGEVVYEGEGPINLRATRIVANVYKVENNWSSDAEWHPNGYWLLGGRGEQKVVAIDIADVDGSLEGTIAYAGEGPINFYGFTLTIEAVSSEAE